MERFKAVEKEMKTKAYSKEGLQLASKLDPKEKEKQDMIDFLSSMNEELERQIEAAEAEVETIQATMKKNKKDVAKADSISQLEEMVERHKFHQGKLELLQRALDNGNVTVEDVKNIEDDIRHYVENNQDPDFMEDDEIYDQLDLQEEEAIFGMGQDADRVSSQDAQSIQDEHPETDTRTSSMGGKGKQAESASASARRPSTQLKSPLPALASLHTPLPGASSTTVSSMKPAPLPTRAPGEPLKYASAAAAAAANDKNGVGIAPLPPPPGAPAAQQPQQGARASTTPSPAVSYSQPAQRPQAPSTESAAPTPAAKSPAVPAPVLATPAPEKEPAPKPSTPEETSRQNKKQPVVERVEEDEPSAATPPLTNGESHADEDSAEEESVYHLPSSLSDLLAAFETTKSAATTAHTTSTLPNPHLLSISYDHIPESADTDAPRHYQPQNPYPYTPSHYPQEPLAIFDDPRLYTKIDTDALFYAFYYRQGTYQQYLAAKALKGQSWRFHKQYQTWFQRHEEPKSITEDYEQGTYRFFDYESTWYVSFPSSF